MIKGMRILEQVCAAGVLGVLLVLGALAPWAFGAWEMWWFWPFVAILSAGVMCGGLGLLVRQDAFARRALVVLGWCGPFLLYALLRWGVEGRTTVWLDAERAILLHLTGLLVAVLTVFCLRREHLPYLFRGLYGSLMLMALYGILNHLLTGTEKILWVPRYPQYAGRASGPYFCPDHFAGAMELLLCMGLGLVLDRSGRGVHRWFGWGAVLLGTVGAVLTLSRGSGLTLVVIGGLVVVWGFYQWPGRVRWAWRMLCAMAGLLVVVGGFWGAQDYRERFVSYGGLNTVEFSAEASAQAEVIRLLRQTSRGRMFAGAWHSWQTAPWFGIGVGMHRHVWPAVAASGDGDRAEGRWPTLLNDDFHSYEVHSDWLQLLQEYGVMGLGLFLLGFGAVVILFLRCFQRVARDWSDDELGCLDAGATDYALVLGGFLVLGAMTFHSLGDFNLQIPGTVWMVAILVGLGIRIAVRLLARPA